MAIVTISNTEEHSCRAISWLLEECDNWKTIPITRHITDEIRTTFAKTKDEWHEHFLKYSPVSDIRSNVIFIIDFEFEDNQDAMMFKLTWG